MDTKEALTAILAKTRDGKKPAPLFTITKGQFDSLDALVMPPEGVVAERRFIAGYPRQISINAQRMINLAISRSRPDLANFPQLLAIASTTSMVYLDTISHLMNAAYDTMKCQISDAHTLAQALATTSSARGRIERVLTDSRANPRIKDLLQTIASFEGDSLDYGMFERTTPDPRLKRGISELLVLFKDSVEEVTKEHIKSLKWLLRNDAVDFAITYLDLKQRRTNAIREIDEDTAAVYFTAPFRSPLIVMQRDHFTNEPMDNPLSAQWRIDNEAYRRILRAFYVKQQTQQNHSNGSVAKPLVVETPTDNQPTPYEQLYSSITRNLNGNIITDHVQRRIKSFVSSASDRLSPEDFAQLVDSFREFNLPQWMKHSPLTKEKTEMFFNQVRVALINGTIPKRRDLREYYQAVQ